MIVMAPCHLTVGRLSMTELDATPQVEIEDFSEELSDEA